MVASGIWLCDKCRATSAGGRVARVATTGLCDQCGGWLPILYFPNEPDPPEPAPRASVKPTCAGCMFYNGDAFYSGDAIGECRRNPPAAVSNGLQGDRYWPTVAEDDWCGEYRPGQPTPPPAEVLGIKTTPEDLEP